MFNGTNQMKRIQRGDEYVLQAMNELMNVLNVVLNYCLLFNDFAFLLVFLPCVTHCFSFRRGWFAFLFLQIGTFKIKPQFPLDVFSPVGCRHHLHII